MCIVKSACNEPFVLLIKGLRPFGLGAAYNFMAVVGKCIKTYAHSAKGLM